MHTHHQGSCLCGEIAYEASQLNPSYVFCHCKRCQKASGTAFGANVSAPIDKFAITRGAGALGQFRSSPNKLRYFCRNCGSPIYTTVGQQPEMVRIRLGTLDTEYKGSAAAHIFVRDRAAWGESGIDTPCFGGWPDASDVAIPGSTRDSTPADTK